MRPDFRDATARAGSDLHYLRIFSGEDLVGLFDKLGGELLDLGFRSAQFVFGDLLVLVDILEHVIGVAAVIADGDPIILGGLLDMLHQLFATILGQLRNRNANNLAVILRRQSEIGILNRFFDFLQRSLVVWRDDDEPRLRRRQRRDLAYRSFGAVVVHLQPFHEAR